MSVEERVSLLFGLYEKWGHENYIGEPVSQLQHAQQVQYTAVQYCTVKYGTLLSNLLRQQHRPRQRGQRILLF